MAKWENRFLDHDLFRNINSIGKSIKKIKDSDVAYLNKNNIEDFERLAHIIRVVEDKMKNADPLLIDINTLNNINAHILQIANYVNNFIVNRSDNELSNVNPHLDNLLREMVFITTINSTNDINNIQEALKSFSKSTMIILNEIENNANDLRTSVNNTKQEVEQIRNAIDKERSRLDNFINQAQEAMSKGEMTRNETISQGEQKRNSDWSNSIEIFKTQTSKEIERVTAEFNKSIEENKSAFHRFQDCLQNETELQIKRIEDLKEEAQNLVHIIGSTGMISGYQKNADRARVTSYVWQCVSVLAFVGLIGFAIYAFSHTGDLEFAWSRFFSRMLTASTFAILGTYAARQASKYERVERRNRNIELELTSINPYLAEMPKEMSDKLKEKLAEKYFGNNEAENEKDNELPDTAIEIMRECAKQCASTVQDVVKKLQ